MGTHEGYHACRISGHSAIFSFAQVAGMDRVSCVADAAHALDWHVSDAGMDTAGEPHDDLSGREKSDS